MSEVFDISLYNDEFFAWHKEHTIEYQTKTFQWFINNYHPKSVIDFGCGIGTYLDVALENGIHKIAGFDIGGEFARKYTPTRVQPFIHYCDCTEEIKIKAPDKYDVVLSFETAEHIEPTGTDQFIKNIVSAAGDTILFTAAPPGQQGCGHINMHPPSFWIDKFMEHGKGKLKFALSTVDRIATAWKEIGCPDYIHKNLLCFIVE